MSARSRDSVARSESSDSTMSYSEFMRLFPDNGACLDYLKAKFYADGTECPKCAKASKFHRIKGRSAYSCQFCGHHVYPTAGTIFHKSTTSLQLWFWAIYLMSSTRCGISAKQLEREIGVTYKTAHRMFKQIHTLLADDTDQLSGTVEIDETYVGGKRLQKGQPGRPAEGSGKVPVLGMVERGGRVRAVTVPNAKSATLLPLIAERVLPRR
jgi:ribosomal protein L24E